MRYPTPCNMDHCYYKVKRSAKREEKVCFSDLTYPEREAVLADHDKESLIRLACHLGECLHNAGMTIGRFKEGMFHTTDEEE